ncbi:hypothetical protein SARU107417_15000 [Salinibacter ruber]
MVMCGRCVRVDSNMAERRQTRDLCPAAPTGYAVALMVCSSMISEATSSGTGS